MEHSGLVVWWRPDFPFQETINSRRSSLEDPSVLPDKTANHRLLIATELVLVEKFITFCLRNGRFLSGRIVSLLDMMDVLAVGLLLVFMVRRWGHSFISIWILSAKMKAVALAIIPTLATMRGQIIGSWEWIRHQLRSGVNMLRMRTSVLQGSVGRHHQLQEEQWTSDRSHPMTQDEHHERQSATFLSDLEMPRAVQKSLMDRGDPKATRGMSNQSSFPHSLFELTEIDKDS